MTGSEYLHTGSDGEIVSHFLALFFPSNAIYNKSKRSAHTEMEYRHGTEQEKICSCETDMIHGEGFGRKDRMWMSACLESNGQHRSYISLQGADSYFKMVRPPQTKEELWCLWDAAEYQSGLIWSDQIYAKNLLQNSVIETNNFCESEVTRLLSVNTRKLGGCEEPRAKTCNCHHLQKTCTSQVS